MSTLSNSLSVRDQNEILRSQSEAAKADVITLDQAHLERYRNPPASTVYPLEYAFYLLGDVTGKTVLDLGCGQGENLPALILRGAFVIGVDLSPHLLDLASRRLQAARLSALLLRANGMDTGLPDQSVDAIFSASVVHHLDIPQAQREMLRILKPGGCVILKEPIRFSKAYAWLRTFFPEQADCSDFEHPLTREELDVMCFPFRIECLRYFRLPFVALVERSLFARWPKLLHRAIRWSARFMEKWPSLETYATMVVVRLVKEGKMNREIRAAS